MGLLSVGMAWYFGTRNKRLRKKIAEHEEKVSKIEKYSSATGYKTMIHDCFHSFSYTSGIVLLSLGVKTVALTLISNDLAVRFLEQFIAGVYIGAGGVLLELFVLLSKANKPGESIKTLKAKIENLKCDVES